MKKISKGFTLIELLIVIAVLGVLAAVILIAIDPLEQIARGRDAGRKSSVGQLGRALQAYFTSKGVYPTAAQWNPVSPALNDLVNNGDIKIFPSNPDYVPTGFDCTVNAYDVDAGGPGGPYCYNFITAPSNEAFTYARLESKSENTKCVAPNINAWTVWNSQVGRAGLVCKAPAAEPVIADIPL